MRNRLIIAKGGLGKSTYLSNLAFKRIGARQPIIVLDSACEHKGKSLIDKISLRITDLAVYRIVNSKDVFQFISADDYALRLSKWLPFTFDNLLAKGIVSFDLSHFLEEGHRCFEATGDVSKYRFYRHLYQWSCFQIIFWIHLTHASFGAANTLVLMDEIELPSQPIYTGHLESGLQFVAAVRPGTPIRGFYKMFQVETLNRNFSHET
jgi:hypothetical protein